MYAIFQKLLYASDKQWIYSRLGKDMQKVMFLYSVPIRSEESIFQKIDAYTEFKQAENTKSYTSNTAVQSVRLGNALMPKRICVLGKFISSNISENIL